MNKQTFRLYICNCKNKGCSNIFKSPKKTAEKCPSCSTPLPLRPISQKGIPKFKQDSMITKLRERILAEQ